MCIIYRLFPLAVLRERKEEIGEEQGNLVLREFYSVLLWMGVWGKKKREKKNQKRLSILFLEDAHDVVFSHDRVLVAVDIYVAATKF